jgi:hypothetical protein
VNKGNSSLDALFDFSSSRHENPQWLSKVGLRSFAIRLTNGHNAESLIVTERENVLNFSVRCLSLREMDDKERYKLCEYAMVRNRSPREAVFFATDRGLTALWVCYRALSSHDPEMNFERYEYAYEQLRRRIDQPLNLIELLDTEKVFEDEMLP